MLEIFNNKKIKINTAQWKSVDLTFVPWVPFPAAQKKKKIMTSERSQIQNNNMYFSIYVKYNKRENKL